MECLLSMLGDRRLSIPLAGIDEEAQEALSWKALLKKLRSAGTR